MLLTSKQAIAPYMPHSGNMVWVDRVFAHGAEHIVTEVDVAPHMPCFVDGRVPAYMGIEMMAQSISVWSGLCRGAPLVPPPLGFLLGVRQFESTVEHMPMGSLRSYARLVVADRDFGLFECELESNRLKIATATLTVYTMPDGWKLT